MPTFVAWLAAYSTNRLADVSWGQRAVETGIAEDEPLVRRAAWVNRAVVAANLLFALITAYLRVCRGASINYIAAVVMCASAYQFVVALLSYFARVAALLCQPAVFRCPVPILDHICRMVLCIQ